MTAQRPTAAVIYLDVEDEITSAASRIRSTVERRRALVLPAGSRVSTSRINFRLLEREATSRGRDLAIVAPEASTRALAASAGLPAFATVVDYEDALTEEGDAPDDDRGAPDASGGTVHGAAGAAGSVTTGDATTTAASAPRPDTGATGQLTGWWATAAPAATPGPTATATGPPSSPPR